MSPTFAGMSSRVRPTMSATAHLCAPGPFELRFESLFHPGRGLSFPCDSNGRVELDTLTDRARHNYLYARAVVGREYASPAVVPGHWRT